MKQKAASHVTDKNKMMDATIELITKTNLWNMEQNHGKINLFESFNEQVKEIKNSLTEVKTTANNSSQLVWDLQIEASFLSTKVTYLEINEKQNNLKFKSLPEKAENNQERQAFIA